MEYLDFELKIEAAAGGGFEVSVVRSPAGEARGALELPSDLGELDTTVGELSVVRGGGDSRAMDMSRIATSDTAGVTVGAAVIRHYALRLVMWRSRSAPPRYARFLDYAANDLNLLQKVGGGYIFIHRYLLEHLAAAGSRPVTDSNRAGKKPSRESGLPDRFRPRSSPTRP